MTQFLFVAAWLPVLVFGTPPRALAESHGSLPIAKATAEESESAMGRRLWRLAQVMGVVFKETDGISDQLARLEARASEYFLHMGASKQQEDLEMRAGLMLPPMSASHADRLIQAKTDIPYDPHMGSSRRTALLNRWFLDRDAKHSRRERLSGLERRFLIIAKATELLETVARLEEKAGINPTWERDLLNRVEALEKKQGMESDNTRSLVTRIRALENPKGN